MWHSVCPSVSKATQNVVVGGWISAKLWHEIGLGTCKLLGSFWIYPFPGIFSRKPISTTVLSRRSLGGAFVEVWIPWMFSNTALTQKLYFIKSTIVDFFLFQISERELTFTFTPCYRPSVRLSSVICLSVCLSVCLSSVTLVHPTQPVEIFGNVSTPFGTLAIRWHPLKISRRSSQGNPSAGGVKHKRGSKI